MSTDTLTGGDMAFIQAGYHEFKPNEIISPHATTAFQKCIRGDDGMKLYYITVYKYDLSKHSRPDGYEPHVQFQQHGRYVNVTMLDMENIPEMEKFFADMYERMNFTPYGA